MPAHWEWYTALRFASICRPAHPGAPGRVGRARRILALWGTGTIVIGCAEKFDLPPVPEPFIPVPGAYNFDHEWRGMGRVVDMAMTGVQLYVLTERDGSRTVEGYLATAAEPVELPDFLIGDYAGARRPVAIAQQGDHLYVADARGPDALTLERECGGDDCALRLTAGAGGSIQHLAGRDLVERVRQDFRLDMRFRLDAFPDGSRAWITLGTAPGRPAIWLEVGRDRFIRPVRSDGAFPVDSLAFGLGEWHDISIRHDWAGSTYAVTMDGTRFTTNVPVYYPLEDDAIGALSIRLTGDGVSGAVDDVVLSIDQRAPGAITDLTVEPVSAAAVRLRWTAPGDDGDTGTVERYEILWARREALLEDGTPVPGPTPLPAGSLQTFDLLGLGGADSVYVYVTAYDESDNAGPPSNLAVTAVTSPHRVPRAARAGRPARTLPDTLLVIDFEDVSELDAWTLGPFFTNDPAPAVLRYDLREGGDPELAMTNPDWYHVHGIAVSPTRIVYVSVETRDPADPSGVLRLGEIQRFDAAGRPLEPLAESGSGAGFVSSPRGIYFDSENVLVADAELNRVQKLDASTTNEGLVQIPPLDVSEAWFSAPTEVVSDERLFIYVADTGSDRILRFDREGAFADTVYAPMYEPTIGAGVLARPSAIEADSASVWVADPANERIVVLTRAGTISGGG